jgi:hypothetical protein
LCARLDIRDIRVTRQARVAYTCGWNPIRAPRVDRCSSLLGEIGADDRSQHRVTGVRIFVAINLGNGSWLKGMNSGDEPTRSRASNVSC